MASGLRTEVTGTKPRPPPPAPLRLQKPTYRPYSIPTSDQELLYDVPSASPISPPPTSPPTFSPTSPTSPTSRTWRTESGRARRTPPPPRARSVTPQPFNNEEAEQFTSHCRAWFFNQDEAAGKLMNQTLAKIHASQRAQFTRIQASIRSAYHASVTARRHAEFQAHITATQLGASLMPHSRLDPSGPTARRERLERFQRFINTWCHAGMAGTKPFFEGLWAVMRLQVIPENIGGAGHRLIEWELDDAVFMESAGKDFMLESIDILKGVLGFRESGSSTRTRSLHLFKGNEPSTPLHPRTQINDTEATRSQQSPVIMSTTYRTRPRATSNPFLETDSGSPSTANTQLELIPQESIQSAAVEGAKPAVQAQMKTIERLVTSGKSEEIGDLNNNLRIWTLPDLTNPEYLALIAAFPAFVSQRTLPRFSTSPSAHQADIEEALGSEDQANKRIEIRFGSGSFWIGNSERSPGWEGGWWQRFKAWWRRIFC